MKSETHGRSPFINPMSQKLKIVSASTITLEEFAEAFNASFAGYFYPQTLNARALARRFRIEQIDAERSLVAYGETERLAGMALLAIRGEVGWIGGFGIVEEMRGQGLGQELMNAVLEQARDCGLRKLTLEVLARNTAARRLYERAGMTVVRDLLFLDRQKVSEAEHRTLSLRESAPARLLRHFERLHQGTGRPAWQRDLPALLSREKMRGFYLGREDMPEAYTLMAERPDGFHYLIDLAATDETQAARLCAALDEMRASLRVVNEPEESVFVKALLECGFVEADRQHEMAMEL